MAAWLRRALLVGPFWALAVSCAATGTPRGANDLAAPPTAVPTLLIGGEATTRPTGTSAGAVLTLEITQSRYGSIVAQTAVGARCSASARLPSGRDSAAQGLAVDSVADGAGRVSWTYGTSGNTNPGTGTHTVRCTYQGQTKSTSAGFRV